MYKKLMLLVSLSINTSILPAAPQPCPDLPGELIGTILSFVDECSLPFTAQVSKTWRAETQRCLAQRVNGLLDIYKGNKNTALRNAAKFNLPATAKELVCRGADVNHKYNDDKTPLDVAEKRNSKDVIKLLLSLDAKSMEYYKQKDTEWNEYKKYIKEDLINGGTNFLCSFPIIITIAYPPIRRALSEKMRTVLNLFSKESEKKVMAINIIVNHEQFCKDHINNQRLAIYEDLYRAKNDMSPNTDYIAPAMNHHSQPMIDKILSFASKAFVTGGTTLLFFVGGKTFEISCQYNIPAELNALYLNITSG